MFDIVIDIMCWLMGVVIACVAITGAVIILAVIVTSIANSINELKRLKAKAFNNPRIKNAGEWEYEEWKKILAEEHNDDT